MKTFSRVIACVSFAFLLGVFSIASAADDILINDFEADNYGDWTVEGAAFGTGPAAGTLGGQMAVTGFEGNKLVNTFLGGDKPVGTLTSPEFTIERDFINFLIGGGGHKDKTCMNLLVDGKVVATATGPNTRPGGSEFLNWDSFDVSKLKGKKAVLQIVDSASGGWGHINVDQIVQSDKKAEKKAGPTIPRPTPVGVPLKLEVTDKFLLLPISNSGQRGQLTVIVDDQLVHRLTVTFAKSTEAVDWWAYLDMSEYQGKTAELNAQAEVNVAKLIKFGDDLPNIKPLYDETLRPQFHFSQQRGWNNDPNGMVYYDGEYHLFWQSNPAGPKWANMYWGHAVSPDMVHWTELPHALRNGGNHDANRHRSMAVGHCFSGSANIDHNNTFGVQEGDVKTMIAAFTDTGCGESLAYSTDRGRTWTYYKGNPVVTHRGRDPKLVWYEPGKHWVLAMYDEDKEVGRNVAIYTSKDLKEWELTCKVPGYFECAELFELPVDGDSSNTRWVVFAANAQYAIGKFDGKVFTPEHEGKYQVHWGPYYASQCFSNTPDGRVVQIGWARINMPDMPFNQTFSVPTNLTLRTTDEGIRMFANPIVELESLRKPGAIEVTDKELTAEQPSVSYDVKGDLVDVVLKVKEGTAAKVVLKVGNFTTTYDFAAQKLDEMSVKTIDGVATVRMLVDRPIHEIVGGDGAGFKTCGGGSEGKPIGTVTVTAEGGTATIESLGIYELESSWNK